MPWPEPSQATRREVTRKVSGGGIMGAPGRNAATRILDDWKAGKVRS